jgi:hypothetical protein
VKFQVMKGLIWLQQCDVLVNPCENLQLKHDKGVSRDLAEYAGPQIYKASNDLVLKERVLQRGQVYETATGFLNCKKLFHVILHPSVNERRENKLNTRTLVRNLIKKAKGYETLSLPFLLCEDFTKREVMIFVCILMQQIDQMQTRKDFRLKVVRLTTKHNAAIPIIVEIATAPHRFFKPSESRRSTSQNVKESMSEGDNSISRDQSGNRFVPVRSYA